MLYPEDFSLVLPDVEIGFGEKGGIQRFSKIGDLEQSLSAESEFWKWCHQSPGESGCSDRFSGRAVRFTCELVRAGGAKLMAALN